MNIHSTLTRILCLAVPLAVSSCIWEPPETDSLLLGRALEAEGQYLEAQTYYEQMTNLAVSNVALHNLHHLYGDILAAMQARQAAPNDPEAYYELGRAYYEKMLTIPDAVGIAPNINYGIADEFARQRQQLQTQAQPALEAATELQARYPDALALKARVYEASDAPERAIPVYQQIIASDAASPESYYRLAALVFNQGDAAQALQYAREGVARFPDDAAAYFTLGKLYALHEMRSEAIEAFQNSLCRNPANPETYHRLSQLYMADGNVIDAERVLRLGVLHNPEAGTILRQFKTLETIMDEKQKNEFMALYDSAVADVAEILSNPTAQNDEPNPYIEIRYLRLLIRYLERQRPYNPPCSGQDDHPFFAYQIAVFQNNIREKQHLIAELEALQAAEAAEAAEAEDPNDPAAPQE